MGQDGATGAVLAAARARTARQGRNVEQELELGSKTRTTARQGGCR